jgi:hypothetical protein
MASSATNERGIRKRREQQKRDRITDELVTKQLMSTADGRRWVWLRLSEAQMFSGNENLDPQYMAWEKGIRNTGLRLLNDVTTFTPQQYIMMTEEARSIKLLEQNDEREPDTDPDAEG